MANEFKIRKGLIVTGASGGTVLDIQGSQGQLFSVTDDLSGSIFAVSDISGVPILDVNSSGNVGIGTTSPAQALHVVGNARVTGAYYDSNNSPGFNGQLLESTGTGTDWVTPDMPLSPNWNVAGDSGTNKNINAAGSNPGTLDIAGGTGISTVTSFSGTSILTVNLDNTAVTAGGYKSADITIDAQGRITAAAYGSVAIAAAASDETTDLAVTQLATLFRMPYAMTITEVRASVTQAPVGSTIIVDIKQSNSSIFTTNLLSIDAGETTSTTAATAPNITTTALTDDSQILIGITQVGSTTPGKGLKITIIGTRA